MEKVGDNLLLQFSNFSFDRVAPDSEWSVRGELCSANHKKEEEEEEERSDGKLLRREPVLSRLNVLTNIPTKNQPKRTQNWRTHHHIAHTCNMPPSIAISIAKYSNGGRHNGNQMAKKIIKAFAGPKFDSSFDTNRACNVINCRQADFPNGTSSTITCCGFSFSM